MFQDTKKSFLIVAGGILLLAFLCLCVTGMWFVSINNTAVTMDENVNQQWAQVGVALQRRADLYETLLSITRGGALQDQAIFGILRDQAAALSGALEYDQAGNPIPPSSDAEAQQLNEALDGFNAALGDVLLYVADNPDQVQSMELFQNFQVQAEGTENRISVERRRYNELVGDAKRYCRTFPNNVVCSLFGFQANDWVYFEPNQDTLDNPELDFGFDDQ